MVVPYDCEAMASALGRLLGDEGLLERLREGCPEVAKTLHWDQPLDETLALYAALSQEAKRK